MALLPKSLGDRQRIDIEILPPGHLIAGLMQLPMMTAAERNRELVADFETQGTRLGKSQMMWIGGLPAADETGLRGNESQMGLVPQPFGLGDGKKALIDLPRDELGATGTMELPGDGSDFQFAASLRPLARDQILATTVVARRSRDRGRVVAGQADLMTLIERLWLGGRILDRQRSLPAAIERQAKGLAKCGQRPFGGIGFRDLEGDVVHLARGRPAAFAGAMAFPNDGCAVSVHRDPHPGDIDRQEGAAILAGQHAFRFDGLPVPAVEPEDSVGLRDRVPALRDRTVHGRGPHGS